MVGGVHVIGRIRENNIVVIGDMMLDRYCVGSVSRISPEAPVPVLRKENDYFVPGGAANVVANLVAAGQHVSVCSVVGNDESASKLIALFEDFGADTSMFLRAVDRKTTVKTRIVGPNHHQFLRIDEEDATEISSGQCDMLIGKLADRMPEADAVILSDYCKGVLTPALCGRVIALAKSHGVRVYVDAKDVRMEKYAGAFLIKPNRSELGKLTGMDVSTADAVQSASVRLLRETDAEYIVATLGSKGMCLTDPKGVCANIRSEAREVFDVSGAGDTAIAYLASAVSSGMSALEAAELANFAAGIKVTKTGTAPVCLYEVDRALNERDILRGNSGKQIAWEELDQIRAKCPDGKIVFTNGCFDILHVGHVNYLRDAAAMGDILVVGLNSDDSVRGLKGEGRPVNGIADRVAILSALEFVDHVVVFEEDTPLALIKRLRPDLLVKGGDYKPEEIVGSEFVVSSGGVAATIPLTYGKSTTDIIDRMQRGSIS
jgi:D-beta-D-heptose 7-phosphate kinase/D-beta-D-heptose 1-phosphate adenosyltransferase